MRIHSRTATLLRGLVLAITVVATLGVSASTGRADDRTDAKAHYQSGTKLYAAGNYKDAVREFAAAEQLVPSGFNDYNLALCYDKLGEAEPAVQYYQSYLKRVPNAPNKPAVDASVARLDAAKKSADVKAAAEASKAAKRAETEAAAQAAATSAAQASAAQAAADARPAVPTPMDTAPPHRAVAEQAPLAAGVGSTGTPGSGTAVTTGDAQLDRVSAIDIDGIRSQHNGGMDMRGEGAPMPAGDRAAGPNGAMQGAAIPPSPAEPKADSPIYKKWWFWVVVAAGAVVVVTIATENGSSSTSNSARELPLGKMPRAAESAPTGLTLMRW